MNGASSSPYPAVPDAVITGPGNRTDPMTVSITRSSCAETFAKAEQV